MSWTYRKAEKDYDDVLCSADILNSKGKTIFTLDCGEYNGLSTQTAAYIVKAVNFYQQHKQAAP
jgi:hypothetical protein